MSPHFLAFDIGTSGVKAVVVDADGALLDSSYRGYNLQMVDDGGVEQDLDHIITSSLDAAAELLSRVRGSLTPHPMVHVETLSSPLPQGERAREATPECSEMP